MHCRCLHLPEFFHIFQQSVSCRNRVQILMKGLCFVKDSSWKNKLPFFSIGRTFTFKIPSFFLGLLKTAWTNSIFKISDNNFLIVSMRFPLSFVFYISYVWTVTIVKQNKVSCNKTSLKLKEDGEKFPPLLLFFRILSEKTWILFFLSAFLKRTVALKRSPSRL